MITCTVYDAHSGISSVRVSRLLPADNMEILLVKDLYVFYRMAKRYSFFPFSSSAYIFCARRAVVASFSKVL